MTKFLKIFLLTVFTALTFTACTEDPEDSTGNIYGIVLDKITNDPLDGSNDPVDSRRRKHQYLCRRLF